MLDAGCLPARAIEVGIAIGIVIEGFPEPGKHDYDDENTIHGSRHPCLLTTSY